MKHVLCKIVKMSEKLHVFKFRIIGGTKGNQVMIQKRLKDIGVEAPKIGEQIQTITKKYSGFRVSLLIIAQNKKYTIKIDDTPVSLLIDSISMQNSENKTTIEGKEKKQLKISKFNQSIPLDTIKQIVHKLIEQGKGSSPEKTAIDVIGVANTMSLTIDNENPKILIKKIKNHEITIDDVIKSQKTEEKQEQTPEK